jgi:VCBS repeat-containing protein
MKKAIAAVLLLATLAVTPVAFHKTAHADDDTVNHPPTVVNQAYSVDSGSTLTVSAPGVLVGSRDIDSDALTAMLVSRSSNGDLDFNSDGSFSYTSNLGFSGTDVFTYKANDGTSDSPIAKVTITVSRTNHAPTASDQFYTVNNDIDLNIYAPGVLSGALDPEGEAVTAILGSRPAHGNLDFNSDGSFKYTAATGYVGYDKFTYKASDGTMDSKPATVSIKVKGPNSAPKVVTQAYTTGKDNNLIVYAPGVLSGAVDPDGEAVYAIPASNPSHGRVDLNQDGSFTYVPDSGYVGPDKFTYKVSDGRLESKPGAVNITVTPQEDTHTIEP